MPATEQTWRDTGRLHVIFGISSVLMLVTTVWMLAVDHRREWKHYQRTFRDVETATISNRIRRRKTSSSSVSWPSEQALAATQREVPPREAIDKFHEILVAKACSAGPRLRITRA